MVTVHPLPAVGREQSGMNIDNVVGIGGKHVFRHKPEESRQNHPVGLFLLQIIQHDRALVEVFATEVTGFNAQVLSPLGNIGILHVVDDAGYLYIGSSGKVFRYLLSIGAVAGTQDCKSCHIII